MPALNASTCPRRRWIDVAVLACLSVGGLYVTARTMLVPRDPERGVALVFAPWTSPETALKRTIEAGARFVRFGGPEFITVAMPDDRGYPDRALASGAWLVVDPQILAACLSPFAASAAIP